MTPFITIIRVAASVGRVVAKRFQFYIKSWVSSTVSQARDVVYGTETTHLRSTLWSDERHRVWAFSQNLKRAAAISRFSAVTISKNEIFEKREIVVARFRFWENAHTRSALARPQGDS
jgi:hypothetical protein